MINVLLIDDDPIEKWIIDRLLKDRYGNQYKLSYASRLDEGLQFLTNRNYDAILLGDDLGDGLTAQDNVPRLIEANPKTPIVIISNFVDNAQHLLGRSTMAYPVIDKKELSGKIHSGLLENCLEKFKAE